MLDYAGEARPLGHRLKKDEYPVPGDDEAALGDQEQSAPASVEQGAQSQPDEQQYVNEEEDDIPDAGAIEEEPSEGSDVSMAAPSEAASSSSEDNVLVCRPCRACAHLPSMPCVTACRIPSGPLLVCSQ